jgi:hypothetical protein
MHTPMMRTVTRGKISVGLSSYKGNMAASRLQDRQRRIGDGRERNQ